ncbi:MAG: hypothetical protein AAF742_00190 [Pseudomonadota bacterium]
MAKSAADLSPEAIASSTFRKKVRTRDRRALFTKVRRSIFRTIFLADEVFAMSLKPVVKYAKAAQLRACKAIEFQRTGVLVPAIVLVNGCTGIFP